MFYFLRSVSDTDLLRTLYFLLLIMDSLVGEGGRGVLYFKFKTHN